ncbi:putative phospholipase [Helianthus anomalus]
MDIPTTRRFVFYTDMKNDKRNEPNGLCCALQGLTDAQNSDIRDMGFETIKCFNIHNIPAGLGYWLLLNYDHKTNELNIGNGKIKITPSKVHEVLGVPMGEISVSEKPKVTKRDAIRERWKSQFVNACITVKNVTEKLRLYPRGGILFKLNFLVIFNSIMGETTKSATVNQKFLTSINSEGDIPNMDWCSYIIACLKRTREGWSGIEPYNGPLTVLAVLYAHERQLKRSPENAVTPALQYVTTDFLVDLERSLYDNGPCSNDDIKKEDPLTPNVEDHVQSLGPEARGQTDEGQTAEGQIDGGQTAIDQNVKVPDVTSVQTDSVLKLKVPIGPRGAQSLSGLSANIGHCNRLEPSKDKKIGNNMGKTKKRAWRNANTCIPKKKLKLLDDVGDDDGVGADVGPKQVQCELAENVSHMSNSLEKSTYQSDIVCVQGYKVKRSNARILEAIFKKHGDIASTCVFKTSSTRTHFLEVVCEVVKRIKTNNMTEIAEDIECQVSDAEAANINVSWIRAHFEAFNKRKETGTRYSLLLEMKSKISLAKRAAQMDLRERCAELTGAQQRFEKAERCVKVMDLVKNNLNDNILESKAKLDSWVKHQVV